MSQPLITLPAPSRNSIGCAAIVRAVELVPVREPPRRSAPTTVVRRRGSPPLPTLRSSIDQPALERPLCARLLLPQPDARRRRPTREQRRRRTTNRGHSVAPSAPRRYQRPSSAQKARGRGRLGVLGLCRRAFARLTPIIHRPASVAADLPAPLPPSNLITAGRRRNRVGEAAHQHLVDGTSTVRDGVDGAPRRNAIDALEATVELARRRAVRVRQQRGHLALRQARAAPPPGAPDPTAPKSRAA